MSRSATDPLNPGPAGFAHRGLHGGKVPENSLAAARAAVDIGAGIECDVRLSSDGQPLVFHDETLERLCGLPVTTADITARAAWTSGRLAGTSERIPSLQQLLEVVARRVPLLVEAKTVNRNASALVRSITDSLSSYLGPVGVMSFDPLVGRAMARFAPHLPRGLVIPHGLRWLERYQRLVIANPHFVAVETTAAARPWVARLRRRMPVYSWTVQTAEQRAALQNQVDALIWEGDGRP